MAECPSGVRPRGVTPPLIILGGAALVALVARVSPSAAPFVGAMPSLVLDTGVLCQGEPVAWPNPGPDDLVDLARGIVSQKVIDMVHFGAWYAFCECVDGTRPTAPSQTPAAGLPFLEPGPSLSCNDVNLEYDEARLSPTGSANVFGTPTAPIGLPAGATSVRVTNSPIDWGDLAPGANQFCFQNFFTDATNTVVGNFSVCSGFPPNHFVPQVLSFTVPATATGYYITMQCQPGGEPCGNNSNAALTLEWFCGVGPGRTAPDCCPPDPSLIARLDRLQLLMNLVVARLGPVDPPVEISTQSVVAEGIANLVLGARLVNVQLSVLGSETKLVPYANPDRLMRAGTIRFGNDFGWQRRVHLDSTDTLVPIPFDSTLVSWSLSPGTSGQLIQLGQQL